MILASNRFAMLGKASAAIFAAIMLALALFWVTPANACPPGYFPIGGGSAGWEGCAPMGPSDGGNNKEDEPKRYITLRPSKQGNAAVAYQCRYSICMGNNSLQDYRCRQKTGAGCMQRGHRRRVLHRCRI